MGKGGGSKTPPAPAPAPEPVTVEKSKTSALMSQNKRRGYASTFKSPMTSGDDKKNLLGL